MKLTCSDRQLKIWNGVSLYSNTIYGVFFLILLAIITLPEYVTSFIPARVFHFNIVKKRLAIETGISSKTGAY